MKLKNDNVMKKIIYASILFCLVVLLACEEQEKFGLVESDRAVNFRMVPDAGSFNLADNESEVTLTMYSSTDNIKSIEVVVELYRFLSNSKTSRFKLTDIDGAIINNEGTSKITISLQQFADAVGVDPGELGGGDVFSIYNIVELENGNVYPDTLIFGGNPFVNAENAFFTSGNTTSFTGQLNFPMVCTVTEPFTGMYTISDDCDLFSGTVELKTVPGNPTQRTFSALFTIAGCCSFPGLGYDLDLVCGRVFVAKQGIGIGCGAAGTVDVVTSDIEDLGPGAYDDLDDSEFTSNIYYSTPACFGGFDCSITFTKQ